MGRSLRGGKGRLPSAAAKSPLFSLLFHTYFSLSYTPRYSDMNDIIFNTLYVLDIIELLKCVFNELIMLTATRFASDNIGIIMPNSIGLQNGKKSRF